MKLRTGIPIGAYAEREVTRLGLLDRTAAGLKTRIESRWDVRTRYYWMLGALPRHEAQLEGLDDAALAQHGLRLRRELVRSGPGRKLTPQAFAWIRETSSRAIGRRHYDAQVLAGVAMLNGALVEMASGEGKSMAISLAAATSACGGSSVEVVTAREERARSCFELLRPLYEALGLRVGLVTREMSREDKRAAYACDLTYVAGFQLLHDYLHDRVVLSGSVGRARLSLERLMLAGESRLESLLLRGLSCAFIDDADQVLIDDGQRPISVTDGRSSSETHRARVEALRIARQLVPGEHFVLDREAFELRWTAAGEAALEQACAELEGAWRRPEWRNRIVAIALSALHLWERGVTHDVVEGRPILLEDGAQRLGADANELIGILVLVEGIEGLPNSDSLRRMSLPRFFGRYHRLAGAAATLREVTSELSRRFVTPVVKIPRRRGSAPAFAQRRVFLTCAAREAALVESLRAITDVGDSALVGVREQRQAAELVQKLGSAGFDAHEVQAASDGEPLNNGLEAAGLSGRITVVSAGSLRGSGVLEPARLHVVAAHSMATRRLERVLFGHATGSEVVAPLESFAALDDELLANQGGEWLAGWLQHLARPDGSVPEWLVRPFLRRAQHLQERRLYDRRSAMLQAEENIGAALAFGGGDE